LLIFLIEFNEVKRSVIDRTAKRYGSLIALERVKNTGNGTVTTWKCKCDCGSIGLYKAMALERTIGINCGCVPESERDEPGKRFGRLTVVSRAPLTEENCKATGYKKIMRGRNALWYCKCDCGNDTVVRGSDFMQGRYSCGCVAEDQIKNCREHLQLGQSAKYSAIRRIKGQAAARGLSWDLTDEDLDVLMAGECYYCGHTGMNCAKGHKRDADFYYNGIDRVDSKVHYVWSNVVSCCFICNRAKSNLPIDEFYAWVDRLKAHNEIKREEEYFLSGDYCLSI
jgi:5-methylcytosine-specific restriction endonuclease McrA